MSLTLRHSALFIEGKIDVAVACATDTLALTENQANINAGINVSATTASLSVIVYEASVQLNVSVVADVVTLILTGNQSQILADTNIQANTDALTLTTYSANVNIGLNTEVLANTANLTLQTYQADVDLDALIQANCDTLNLQTYGADVDIDVNVQAALASLALNPYAANINARVNIHADYDDLRLKTLHAMVTVPQSIFHYGDWRDYKGDRTWSNNFKEQPDKWGYLNNPRWQTSPQAPISYTGNESAEPQVWALPGGGYSSGTSKKHIPCGHWHKIKGAPQQQYQGQIYVTDHLSETGINVFDLDGNLIRTIITPYNGYTGPHGICVYNEEVFVTIQGEQIVYVCDVYGNNPRTFGSPGTSNGNFNGLRKVFAINNKIYTVEADVQTPPYGTRVQIWDIQGNYLNSFKPTGGLAGGVDLWVSDSNIYVISIYFTEYPLDHSVHWPSEVYRLDYAYLGIGGPMRMVGYKDNFYCTANGTRVCVLDSALSLVSDFYPSSGPAGIGVYEDEIFCLATGTDQVQVFDLSGNFKREWSVHTLYHSYSTNYMFVYAHPV